MEYPYLMTEPSDARYDVFLSYSQVDKDWVLTWLKPRLEEAGLGVVGEFNFTPGAPQLENIQHAVQDSYCTVLVLTPAYVQSDDEPRGAQAPEGEWKRFETLIAETLDPSARRRRVLPLKLAPCKWDDPLRRTVLDFTQQNQWHREVKRLIQAIDQTRPIAPPIGPGRNVRDVAQWGRWLRRYGRVVWPLVLSGLAMWLVSAMLLGWPPFWPDIGWSRLGRVPLKPPWLGFLSLDGAYRLSRAGETLLASTMTGTRGCDQVDTGLWLSRDEGATWTAVRPPLDFTRDPKEGCILASIEAFAVSPAAPHRVYATTSDVGLLRSDDAGATWRRFDLGTRSDNQLKAVAVTSINPDQVFVAPVDGGLFRSDDRGQTWMRLDGTERCPAPGLGLAAGVRVNAMVAVRDILFLGAQKTTAAASTGGIFLSRDAGQCWEGLDETGERYMFLTLIGGPGPTDVVVLVRDNWAGQGEARYHVWRVQGQTVPPRTILWRSDHTVSSLYVDPITRTGYVVTNLGEVFAGTVDQPGAWYSLAGVTRCLLPPTCLTDFAPAGQPGPPLLLANDYIYRLERVPWVQRLWP